MCVSDKHPGPHLESLGLVSIELLASLLLHSGVGALGRVCVARGLGVG